MGIGMTRVCAPMMVLSVPEVRPPPALVPSNVLPTPLILELPEAYQRSISARSDRIWGAPRGKTAPPTASELGGAAAGAPAPFDTFLFRPVLVVTAIGAKAWADVRAS